MIIEDMSYLSVKNYKIQDPEETSYVGIVFSLCVLFLQCDKGPLICQNFDC